MLPRWPPAGTRTIWELGCAALKDSFFQGQLPLPRGFLGEATSPPEEANAMKATFPPQKTLTLSKRDGQVQARCEATSPPILAVGLEDYHLKYDYPASTCKGNFPSPGNLGIKKETQPFGSLDLLWKTCLADKTNHPVERAESQ